MHITENHIKSILEKKEFSKEDITVLLQADKVQRQLIYAKSVEIKEKYIGKYTYFRGLIEFSNLCVKDCYYCGIRKSNQNSERYNLSDEQILQAVAFAHKNKYGSIVLQSGERSDKAFTDRISNLLKTITKNHNGELGITLSLGEQSLDVYSDWVQSGAHRYLLRIESTNRDLYYKIHPNDAAHAYEQRLEALCNTRRAGLQAGTGVMVALPFQTYEDLADDLLFFQNFDVDMVGMGPYIEHSDTPLFGVKAELMPLIDRFDLTMKMIAVLRIMMKDINIAAATALQAIDPIGREKAIRVGANIIMPNITPSENRKNYQLYDNKPCIDEGADDCTTCMEERIQLSGDEIGYGLRGDSPHFFNRGKSL